MATQAKFLYFGLVCIVTGTYLTPSRKLPDFSLIEQRGRTFSPANLHGHRSMLLRGYMNCPDFCRTTLTTLAAVQKYLHSGAVLVLEPDGRLAAVLTGPFDVDALQGDFQRIAAAGGILAGRA
jgi:hypothetical protein